MLPVWTCYATMAKKPKTLTELKLFIALYANIPWNTEQIAYISVLGKVINSGYFHWNQEINEAFDNLIKFWPNFPGKRPTWKHLRPHTPLTEEISNHNFVKIADRLVTTFWRGGHTVLKEEYLNALRYAINIKDLEYANEVLTQLSNWLIYPRKKNH